MKFYPNTVTLAAKHLGGWCVHVDVECDSTEVFVTLAEAVKEHLPDPEPLFQVLVGGMFHFDTEKEAWQFFEIFNTPPIYASCISAALYHNGDPIDENT